MPLHESILSSQTHHAHAPRDPTSDGAHHIDSTRLLAGARELVIEHLGQRYYLRLTRNDKLILTK